MITASKVALAHACPVAFALPHTHEVQPGQHEGNERHLELEASIDVGAIPEIIERRWPGYTWRAEVAFALDLATDTARELGTGIKRAYGEHGVFTVAGTADIVGRGPAGELVVVDRKSHDPSVPRANVNGQLHTLALAACRAYGVDRAEVAIWHELRPLDVAEIDVLDLDVFAVELRGVVQRVIEARNKARVGVIAPNPGAWCRWCPAFLACPQQKALTLDVDAAIPIRIESAIPFRDDKEAADAWDLLGRIELLTKRIRAALYARAGERPIPLSDGRLLGPVEKLGATEIDADIAHAVIAERFGIAVANDSVTRKVTQAGIERALDKAGHKSAKREVMKRIAEAGGARRETKVAIEPHQIEEKAS